MYGAVRKFFQNFSLHQGKVTRNSLKSTFLYYANQYIGANLVLSLKAKFKNSCGKCMPSSRFSGDLQVLISYASKIHLLRQFVLVRKIFEDSQEMVWPECKQCSAKADLCECLFSTAF